MELVRFLPFKGIGETLLHNLIYTLNALQDAFLFGVADEEIPLPPLEGPDEVYPVSVLEHEAFSLASGKFPDEYAVAVCDVPLRDELSSSFDGRGALISIAGWKQEYPAFSVAKLLTFTLVDILLSRRVTTPVHDDTRGCPMDFCDDRQDRVQGLKRCEFCGECRHLVLDAVRRGTIKLTEVVAVYRMLDSVKGLKRAFVLMPFGGAFDDLYKNCLCPALEACEWVCRRADEIYEPREIIDLVWEEIHRSDLVIADLTGRNPDVFYEVGYAHALGRPTVLLAQSLDEVPFDLRHRQLLKYSMNPDGFEALRRSLRQYL